MEGSRDSSQPAGDAHWGLCEGNDGGFSMAPHDSKHSLSALRGGGSHKTLGLDLRSPSRLCHDSRKRMQAAMHSPT